MNHARPVLDPERIASHTLPVAVPASHHEAQTLAQQVAYLLSGDHRMLPEAHSVLARVHESLPDVLENAFGAASATALLDVQQALFAIYETTFSNPLSAAAAHEHAPWLVSIRRALEDAWFAFDLPQIEHELPPEADLQKSERLTEWFVAQARKESPTDRLLVRFLAEQATVEDFKKFLLIDVHLNYRFYDALALAQLHFSETVKAELSRHMWDECGRGNGDLAHTRQFTRALQKLELPQPQVPVWDDWRLYAGYNLYLCFGLNRRNYFKSLGSLAMPELFDPDRDRAVIAGLERLGFDARNDFQYYSTHIEGDEEHGQEWLDNVITPIVRAQPEAARELALGAALRMEYMRRFNACLYEKFRLHDRL
jgi:heme oxygenase-like protein